MPDQAIQTHSKVLWSESSASGVLVSAEVSLFVDDAGDVTPAAATVEDALAIDWQGNGEYELLWAEPGAIVADGAEFAPVETLGAGTVAAILADDGTGIIELTTDLGRTAAAELLSDGAGTLVVVALTANRLDMVTTGDGNTTLY